MDINNIWELIIALVALLIPTLMKWRNDNKRRNNLDFKIDILSNDVKFVKESTKDNLFLKSLRTDLAMDNESVVSLKKLENIELRQYFRNLEKQICESADLILIENFEIDLMKMKENMIFMLSISIFIDPNKLKISNPMQFLELTESSIIPVKIDSFLIDYPNYKNKTNGERRDDFKKALKKLYVSIVEATINLFNNCEKFPT